VTTAEQGESHRRAAAAAEAELSSATARHAAAVAELEARAAASQQRALVAQTELAAREGEWAEAEERAAGDVARLQASLTAAQQAVAKDADAVRAAMARVAGAASAGASSPSKGAAHGAVVDGSELSVPEVAAAQRALQSVCAALASVEDTLATEQALVRSVCLGMLNPRPAAGTDDVVAGSAAGSASANAGEAARVLRSLGLYDEAQSLENSCGGGSGSSSAVSRVIGPAPAPFTALLPASVTVSAVSSALFEALSSVWSELNTLQARFRLRDPNSNTAAELGRLSERGALCQSQISGLWQHALATRAALLSVTASSREFAAAAARGTVAVARAVRAAGSEAALWHGQVRQVVFDVDASDCETRLKLIHKAPCPVVMAVPALDYQHSANATASSNTGSAHSGMNASSTDANTSGAAPAGAAVGADAAANVGVAAQLAVDRDVLLVQRAELVRQLQHLARHYDETVLRARAHVEEDAETAATVAAAQRQVLDLQTRVDQLQGAVAAAAAGAAGGAGDRGLPVFSLAE